VRSPVATYAPPKSARRSHRKRTTTMKASKDSEEKVNQRSAKFSQSHDKRCETQSGSNFRSKAAADTVSPCSLADCEVAILTHTASFLSRMYDNFYCFFTSVRLSSGLRSISLMSGLIPARAGTLSTVTVNSCCSCSILCFCRYRKLPSASSTPMSMRSCGESGAPAPCHQRDISWPLQKCVPGTYRRATASNWPKPRDCRTE